jgi:V/A-type H+/Na+-transporting ATPase subunit K
MSSGLAVVLAGIGMGLMIGMSGLGSAIGLVIGGQSAIGAIKKRPEVFGSTLILSGLPATQGLYGFVCFIMYQGVVNDQLTVFQGAVVLGAGIAIGLSAMVSAVQQGKVCAAGISAIGSGHNVFGNTFILAVFPEFYAILALVAAILMQGLL